MDDFKQLEKLLDEYIEESKNRHDEYNKKAVLKDLYSELLNRLKRSNYDAIKQDKLAIDILLNTIYSSEEYTKKLYRILLNINLEKQNQDDYQKLVDKISNDYNQICHELDNIKSAILEHQNRVSSVNVVKLCFKNTKPIKMDKYTFRNIVSVINYYREQSKISDKEAILMINEFKLYNRRLLLANATEKEKKYYAILHDEIPNILNSGFHSYVDPEEDEIDIDDKTRIKVDNYVNTTFDVIKDNSCKNVINEIKKYQDYYKINNEEYKYMLISLLDRLFNELYFYYQSLKDLSIYSSGDDRPVAVNNYYNILDKYLTLYSYYCEFNKTLTMDEIVVEDAPEEFLTNNNRELIYAHSEVDLSKAKFIQDMKNIPFEYYDRVYRLLMSYKDNTISDKEVKRINIKSLNNYIELKDDQIRIVIKHLKDNIYVVLGLFAKKDDNDPMKYDIIVKRKIPNIDSQEKQSKELALAKIYESELSGLVEKKGRKGNR